MSRARTEFRHEKLTWPEINDAIELRKICLVPCGAVEQHGAASPARFRFPGGCAHACESETSLYMYLDGDNVRDEQIKSDVISFNEENSPFNWVDLFAAGPATLVSWTSSYSETGVLGEAELASAEKGRSTYEEAVQQLARFVDWFRARPVDVRRDHHRQPPTMPMPWGQKPIS